MPSATYTYVYIHIFRLALTVRLILVYAYGHQIFVNEFVASCEGAINTIRCVCCQRTLEHCISNLFD